MRVGVLLVALVVLWLGAPAHAQVPGARITSGPPAQTEATDATFEFETTAFAPFASFECSLDSAPYRHCESPLTFTGLLGGPHEFAVRLIGPLTHREPSMHRWTVLTRSEILPPAPDPPKIDPPKPPVPERPSERRDADGCAYGANRPHEVATERLQRAAVCLVNRRRAKHGLRPVRVVGSLTVAATRHVRDMVRRRYFEHVSPGGGTPSDRLRRSGYISGRSAFTVGEVLAWGTARLSTPAATVAAWMRSPGHRRVLLYPAFRDVGIGVVPGIPLRARRDGGTWAGEFGRR